MPATKRRQIAGADSARARGRKRSDSPIDELKVIRDSLDRLARLPEELSPEQVEEYQGSVARILRGTAELASRLSGSLPATWSQYISARTAFRSDAALAETLGVNRSRVTRWKQGEAADRLNQSRLRALGIVVAMLSDYLDRRAVPDWLGGFNPHLGDRRPIDVIISGRVSEVIAAIEAEQSGAFA